jgi:hypothetical protein
LAVRHFHFFSSSAAIAAIDDGVLSARLPLLLRNLQTGHITECSSTKMYAQKIPDDQCATALEKAGWVRLNRQ